MNKKETMMILRYLAEHRPNSVTLGRRAIQRFNSINKARWEDLINDKTD